MTLTRGADLSERWEELIDLSVAVIIEAVTELLRWRPLLRGAGEAAAIGSALKGSKALTDPEADLTEGSFLWKILVNISIAVIIEAIAALFCGGPFADIADQLELIFAATQDPKTLARADADIADLVAFFEALIGLSITVIIKEVTALNLGGLRGAGELFALWATDKTSLTADQLSLNCCLSGAGFSEALKIIGDPVAVVIDLVTAFGAWLRRIAGAPTARSFAGLTPNAESGGRLTLTNALLPDFIRVTGAGATYGETLCAYRLVSARF